MDPAQWPADYRERLERAAPDARAASAMTRGDFTVNPEHAGRPAAPGHDEPTPTPSTTEEHA